MDPVFTPATTATLAVGAEISFGSVATLQEFWDVYVDTSNVPPGGQIEARLYGEGPSGQKILMGAVGVAPVPRRIVPPGLPICARETFVFPQSLVGVAGFRPDQTRTGGTNWELRLVALTPDAAVSVRALLAGYSFSEPTGSDSMETTVAFPTGVMTVASLMVHPNEFHDISVDFSQVPGPSKWELIAAAGVPTPNLSTQMLAVVASFDCPTGFSQKTFALGQGMRGVGAFAYALVGTNLGSSTINVTTTFDGYDSICCDSGGAGSLANRSAPVWHVNANTGLDSNDGTTAATALQTLGELTMNRWGKGALLQPPGPTFTTTIFLDSDIPASDPLYLDVVLGSNVTIVFRGGTFTPIFAGTLTAATPVNRAANQGATITDVAAPWAVNTAQRIRNTTVGPRLDSVAGIAADLGAGVARINRPWTNFYIGPVPAFIAPGDFLAGDTYAIESLPKMTVANISFECLLGTSQLQFPTVNLVDVDTVSGGIAVPVNVGAGAAFQTFTSRLTSFIIQGGTNSFYNSIFKEAIIQTAAASNAILGGLALNPNGFFAPGGVNSSMIMTLDPLVQSAFVQMFGVMVLDDVGVFDSITNGFQTNGLLPFSFVETIPFFGSGALYGSGQANVGFHQGSDALFIYASAAALTITGAAGDFECGAAGLLATPDPATNTNTAAIAQTWANLAAARPAGFGGTVINPSNHSRILPFVP